MQAIRTKYFGPSNTRPSRIQAAAEAGTLYFTYESGLGSEGNHAAAVKAYIVAKGWTPEHGRCYIGEWVPGDFDGATYWTFKGA